MNRQKAVQPHRQTIGQLAVSLMRAYDRQAADTVVRAVREVFPESKFNREQFHYYHSLLDRGMVDSRGRRQAH